MKDQNKLFAKWHLVLRNTDTGEEVDIYCKHWSSYTRFRGGNGIIVYFSDSTSIAFDSNDFILWANERLSGYNPELVR